MVMPDLKRMLGEFREEMKNGFGKVPFDSDIDVSCWVQTWPDTGGGMAEPGCMYGQAITRELVTCFVCRAFRVVMVCFGGQAAYICDLSRKFWTDYHRHQIVGISKRDKYRYTIEELHDIMNNSRENFDGEKENFDSE